MQHDTSHHLFAPHSGVKWYLITSIDDYSRYLLYGELMEKETSVRHIEAFKYVCLNTGIPFSYYVDNHSIFRFIERRDSLYYKHRLKEDESDPQWKKVLLDLKVKINYAGSAPAKGKIERPYRWLQDHLVRTCARKGITSINNAREVLRQEINRYNFKQVHSSTGEIPAIMFENAIKQNKSLFTDYKTPHPYESIDDVFCLRLSRTTDAYRNISVYGMKIKLPVDPHEKVELRITPNDETGLSKVRFWHNGRLIDKKIFKNIDLRIEYFK
ncbi:MAG: transposase family protein [bacterium]